LRPEPGDVANVPTATTLAAPSCPCREERDGEAVLSSHCHYTMMRCVIATRALCACVPKNLLAAASLSADIFGRSWPDRPGHWRAKRARRSPPGRDPGGILASGVGPMEDHASRHVVRRAELIGVCCAASRAHARAAGRHDRRQHWCCWSSEVAPKAVD
jgi:hypothetical protein